MREKVPGIKIAYKSTDIRGCQVFSARFYIAKRVPSKDFVSNPQIRKAIEEYGKYLGEPYFGEDLGQMFLYFRPETKTAQWGKSGYYPFDFGSELFFAHKGIAELLEYKAIKEMKKRFPKLKKFEHTHPLPFRIEQLEKRGIIPHKPYSYRKAKWKLRKKIFLDQLKHQKIPKAIINTVNRIKNRRKQLI